MLNWESRFYPFLKKNSLAPLVSIIIATYNRPKHLSKAIDSLLQQTMGDWECLIIDDHSIPYDFNENKKIARKDARIKLLRNNHKNKNGPSVCRNIGLKVASGRYIQFFDDDDIMFPEMLETKINFIQFDDLDVIISPLAFYDVQEQNITHQNKILSIKLIEDYILGKVSWYVSGPLWKRKFLKSKFDENIQTLDDWDFNLLNIYNNPKINYLDKPLQYYNRYSLESTLSTKKINRGSVQNNSLFFAYSKHLEILQKEKILTPILAHRLINLIIGTLRESLEERNENVLVIFKFIQKNSSLLKRGRYLKLYLGFYSYKIFGKGYRFIN
ncbi:glycosyltransferase family 2 protein [Aequorivita flava]|uniref:Glycosyltransferase family 2 protein n=1 Tax=Aequorivita flava TaxID=3114371 RepID=A0AB35YUA8_9FLAO